MGAARYGNEELVRELLARGATPWLQDSSGYTALMWCVMRCDAPQVVEMLVVAGCSIQEADDENHTVLMWASILGHLEAARMLLDLGADPRVRHAESGTARDSVVRARKPGWEEWPLCSREQKRAWAMRRWPSAVPRPIAEPQAGRLGRNVSVGSS
jgi:ankyrin repeat protein